MNDTEELKQAWGEKLVEQQTLIEVIKGFEVSASPGSSPLFRASSISGFERLLELEERRMELESEAQKAWETYQAAVSK